jgi:hypothetical protein
LFEPIFGKPERRYSNMNTTTIVPVNVTRVGSLPNKMTNGLLESSVLSHPAPITLRLTDGEIEADGTKFRLPIGLQRHLSGSDIKALLGKYRGLLLFLKNGKSWQRLGDRDVVELNDDSKLKTERPIVRTAPKFSAD